MARNGVGGHSWELGPVPIPNTEVNLPGDPGGSVVREPMRSLDRCQLRYGLSCASEINVVPTVFLDGDGFCLEVLNGTNPEPAQGFQVVFEKG